jgi:hypothetical protein
LIEFPLLAESGHPGDSFSPDDRFRPKANIRCLSSRVMIPLRGTGLRYARHTTNRRFSIRPTVPPGNSLRAFREFRDHLTAQDGYGWWLAAFFLLPLALAEALTALGLGPLFDGFKPYLGLARFLEEGTHAPQVWVYGVLALAATPFAFIALFKATSLQDITRSTAWTLLLGSAVAAALFSFMLFVGFPHDVALHPSRGMKRLLVARDYLPLGYGFYMCVVFSVVFFAYAAARLALQFIREAVK